MKQVSILMLLLGLLSAGCKKHQGYLDVPSCIQAKIDQQRNNPESQVGSVEEYKYQGKIVYAFQPDNRIIADGATAIYSSDCSSLCHVGGFGGPQINQCNGENFYTNSVLIRVVWTKP